MRNKIFDISFDKESGLIGRLTLNDDSDGMNWCKSTGKWGYVHQKNIKWLGDTRCGYEEMKLLSFNENEDCAEAVFENGYLRVAMNSRFDGDGNLVQSFKFKNIKAYDLFLNENNCAIEAPFNDEYTSSDECMIHKCNTHIWCGGNTAYINALKMGESNQNLGLIVIKGEFDSYSVINGAGNDRGRFLLNLKHTELVGNGEYDMEWVIFPHTGNEDFVKKALRYASFININAEHYTVFGDESIKFSAEALKAPENVRIYTDKEKLDFEISGKTVNVDFKPKHLGEYRIYIEIDGIITWADFIVKPKFEELLKKRIDFIVDNQQYNNKNSRLDGAFLIYDNKKEHMIFEECWSDHNACRERMGMTLLLCKYLQAHKNEKFYNALMRSIDFINREIYDDESGYVYGTLERSDTRIRLYNAPWISLLFSEMYMFTEDTVYLDRVIKLLRNYYSLGGSKFYPNGISISCTLKAFKKAEREEYNELLEMFGTHVDNMVKNSVHYPPHEVNFEQTIVSPAATFISELAFITCEEKYLNEAKKHIKILERFSGNQPSYHMNEIPIRYWDDYWFGKFRIFGDTFPHYWSCLTARSFNAYFKASGDKEYLKKAEECMRNCMCLFDDSGRGSAAYIYPYQVNGKYGDMYDDWANDQDFALYFALEIGLNA